MRRGVVLGVGFLLGAGAIALFASRNLQLQNGLIQNPHLVPASFVGCASEDFAGDQFRPPTPETVPLLNPEQAAQLVFYQSETGPGVLAPSGWHCYGYDYSSGSVLVIAPTGSGEQLTNGKLKSFAVVRTSYGGETSGRFAVAQIADRLFPVAHKFVESVEREGIEPQNEFSDKPYPTDRVTYPSRGSIAKFVTPSGDAGLGTYSNLDVGDYPISGVAILTNCCETPDLVLVTIRLPSNLAYLSDAIIESSLPAAKTTPVVHTSAAPANISRAGYSEDQQDQPQNDQVTNDVDLPVRIVPNRVCSYQPGDEMMQIAPSTRCSVQYRLIATGDVTVLRVEVNGRKDCSGDVDPSDQVMRSGDAKWIGTGACDVVNGIRVIAKQGSEDFDVRN